MSVSLKVKRRYVIVLILMVCSATLHAEPWYSGPLLSDPAIVTPVGHGYLAMYFLKTVNYGDYLDNRQFERLPRATTDEIDTAFNYGLTKDQEVQLYFAILNNKTEGKKASNLGDTTITFAKQVMLQNGRKWPPNIKVMLKETFPTGRYDQLNPNLYGTDATGQGGYLTTFSANMEHVIHLVGEHYLVGFATASLELPNRIALQGNSIYGGGAATKGTIWPGNRLLFNLAAEYSPSQHWGFIMEAFMTAQRASHFEGRVGPTVPRFSYPEVPGEIPGFLARIKPLSVIFNRLRPTDLNLGSEQEGTIGHGNSNAFTLAPAIDYSFSGDTSISVGVWLTVAGKNVPAFYTPMLRYTAEW